jgi:A/G-specific adenine glycosylase
VTVNRRGSAPNQAIRGRRSRPAAEGPKRSAAVAAAVEAWFALAQRPLPWRVDRTGYTALVSEAMLQQTQVARVVSRYVEFMRQFPTVAALAAAPESAVLAAWQGLGYYGRAKRLHAAAQTIEKRFGGTVPRDVEELRTLPGVGRYTAGAIASIVFGDREPIVDTNVARVVMRISARRGSTSDRTTVQWAWEQASELVSVARNPGVFNEGLMELGATICPAGEPKCPICPLRKLCVAAEQGIAATIPAVSPKAQRKRVYHHAVVFLRGERVLLVQRPSRGLWSSMWQVPTHESEKPVEAGSLASMIEPKATSIEFTQQFVHQTSHREVIFVVHRGTTRSRSGGEWVERERLDQFALSNPMRAIVHSSLALGSRPG